MFFRNFLTKLFFPICSFVCPMLILSITIRSLMKFPHWMQGHYIKSREENVHKKKCLKGNMFRGNMSRRESIKEQNVRGWNCPDGSEKSSSLLCIISLVSSISGHGKVFFSLPGLNECLIHFRLSRSLHLYTGKNVLKGICSGREMSGGKTVQMGMSSPDHC